ncbi:MAG: GtrA family protein [Gammaproteobacteria bacterium]|nr:GtrA family protein [Gammaproteobacteria bacterium]MCP5135977.1 GtrA family protein [Gammaproteobacteria bacterium]
MTQFVRFVTVGALNFILTFIVFYVLLEMFSIHYNVALGMAWVVGVFFTYVLNYLWVFKTTDALIFKSYFLKYATSGLLVVAMNMGLLEYLVGSKGYPPFITQVILIPLVVVLNYYSAKLWSLRPPIA